MIKALATDLDGTLFYPKRKLRLMQSANKKFLLQFIASGKKLILVTGRNKFVSSKVAANLDTDDLIIIGCNGGFVVDKGKIILENEIDTHHAKELHELLLKDKKVKSILIFTNKYNIVLDDSPLNRFERLVGSIGMKMQGVYNEPYVRGKDKIDEIFKDESIKIYKIMPWYGLHINGKELARQATIKYQKSVGDKFDIAWSKDAVEFVKYGINKAEVLKKIIASYQIKSDEIMVIGDSGNDVSLFRNFENSYVMKQAPEEVKKEAKIVVESVAELNKYCN